MIQNLIPALRKSETQAEAMREEKMLQPKHGPRGVRYLSSGQIRRMRARQQKAAQRKADKAHRRAWLDKRHHEANVRGQIAVLRGAGTDACRQNVIRGMERKYANSPDAPADFDETADFLESVKI